MDSTHLITNISSTFPNLKVIPNFSLSPVTTLKIGGPADLYIRVTDSHQLQALLRVCKLNQVTPVIIGNGSNLLISDSGVSNLVIHNTSSKISFPKETWSQTLPTAPAPSSRRTENDPQLYLDISKIDYDESNYPTAVVTLDSGVPLPLAINQCFNHNLTGLQWFAYIPGTIGGAIYYNIHGGNYHFHQFLDSVTYYDLASGKLITTKSSELNWDYGLSDFQNHPSWYILSATLRLYRGDVARARQTASAWISQKSKVQPMNSAGSVFKNPTLDQCLPLWNAQKSTGWIIDQELGLKGYRVGGAQIGPQHANIFTNQGNATSADFMALIEKVKSEAKSKLKLDLELEIKLLGF